MYNAVTAALEEKLSPEELYPAALMKFMVSPTAAARNTVAQTLGLLGDIEELNAADFGAPHAIRSTVDAPDSSAGMMPSSEEMARMLGGNPDHPSWLWSALIAPGPGEILAGLKVAGKALMAGMKEVAPGAAFAQALFHGTPHKFDMFDLKAIGTGEGAQAYGHGLYFAESPGVAKSYRSTLTTRKGKFQGDFEISRGGKEISASDRDRVAEVWPNALKKQGPGVRGLTGPRNLDEMIAHQQKNAIDDFLQPHERQRAQESVKKLEALKADGFEIKLGPPGHLYEVDIPDETIEKMLDWDAPLSEQPESVQRALDELRRPMPMSMGDLASMTDAEAEAAIRAYKKSGKVQKTMQVPPLDPDAMVDTGRSYYKALSRKLGGDEAASKFLNEAGIPGIRYYDADSRVVGDSAVLINGKPLDEVSSGNKLIDDLLDEEAMNDDVVKAVEQRLWIEREQPNANIGEIDEAIEWIENNGDVISRPRRTRNIVVFNPDDITSVKRDGELVYEAAKPTTSGVGGLTDGVNDVYFTGYTGNKVRVEVLKNPTPNALKRHFGRNDPFVRWMRDDDGNLLVWKSEDGLHHQVIDAANVNVSNPDKFTASDMLASELAEKIKPTTSGPK
jgi:hypothetical protein